VSSRIAQPVELAAEFVRQLRILMAVGELASRLAPLQDVRSLPSATPSAAVLPSSSKRFTAATTPWRTWVHARQQGQRRERSAG
jgi:hypothetical protein